MSRRPADKAAQNQQVIKNLLRLEGNKHCADCKRNKHPRWASWNLGIFICIRCSGIHRGMGTHISRVKSVDLDAWTDEQLQSIMKWGNARANRYWESKLAPGHVPSDAKIENFIRTKYESRRWVMDGPIPDPSTLGGDGDEDVPLTTVQERARLDRSSSQRAASNPLQQAGQVRRAQPAATVAASFSLIDGGEDASVPQRASTTEPTPAARPPPKPAAQPSQLLGELNFLSSPPERPSSTSSGPGNMSRPDLKQSILSLYASNPAATPAPPSSQPPGNHSRQSSSAIASPIPGNSGSFGGLNDAFGSLTFGSTRSPAPKPQTPVTQTASVPSYSVAPKAQPAKPDAYAALSGVLASPRGSIATPSSASSPPPLSGGGFFDTGPRAVPKQAPVPHRAPAAAPPLTTQTSTDDWGDFSIASESSQTAAPPTVSNKPSTLLDFTSGGASHFSPPPSSTPKGAADSSVFNLSSKPKAVTPAAVPAPTQSAFPSDPWGANEWNTPDPAPIPSSSGVSRPSATSQKAANTASSDFGWSAPANWGTSAPAAASTTQSAAFDMGGWGETPASSSNTGLGGFGATKSTAAPAKIQPEEDFGGWGASETVPARPEALRSQSTQQSTGGGLPSTSDLFDNVWG